MCAGFALKKDCAAKLRRVASGRCARGNGPWRVRHAWPGLVSGKRESRPCWRLWKLARASRSRLSGSSSALPAAMACGKDGAATTPHKRRRRTATSITVAGAQSPAAGLRAPLCRVPPLGKKAPTGEDCASTKQHCGWPSWYGANAGNPRSKSGMSPV